MHLLIVGVAQPKPARDLLRRVILPKALLEHPAQLGTELELRRPRSPRAPPSLTVRGMSTVATPTATTIDLTRDRRVRAAQRSGDRPGRRSAGDPARDLLALPQAQTALRTPASPRPNTPDPPQMVTHDPGAKTKPTPDLTITQPLRPQLPNPIPNQLAQGNTPRHHHTSIVSQPTADSLRWCRHSLNPPVKGAVRVPPSLEPNT